MVNIGRDLRIVIDAAELFEDLGVFLTSHTQFVVRRHEGGEVALAGCRVDRAGCQQKHRDHRKAAEITGNRVE